MVKFSSVIIGAAVVVAGFASLIAWKSALITVLKGTVPLMLVFAGAIAVIAGISEMRDEAAAKKEEPKEEKK